MKTFKNRHVLERMSVKSQNSFLAVGYGVGSKQWVI